MSRRKRVLLWAGLLVAGGLAVLAWATQSNVRPVQVGMTEREVEVALGGTATTIHFSSEKALQNWASAKGIAAPSGGSLKQILGTTACALVVFDNQGQAVGVYYLHTSRIISSMVSHLDCLRRWLGF
jgi:hypothetical protein